MIGRGRKAILGAVALSLAALSLRAQGEYAVVDLGALVNPPSLSGSSVGGVNAAAQVALTTSADGINFHAFRYGAGTSLDLGTLGGADSFGHAINDAGLIVGRSRTAAGIQHAFLWTPGGTGGVASNPQMKDLNPTGNASDATAINASGQIAGYVNVPIQGQKTQDRPFLRTGASMVQLPFPTTGNFANAYAYALNDSGHVVGEAYTNSSGSAHGFFYNGTTSVEIGDLGGGSSTPFAINKSDRVVGYSANGDGYDRAFVYKDGVMSDLGTLGGHFSYARSINNHDQIVGGAFADDADSIYHGFVSDGTTMTDLNAKLTSKAANWVLGEASSINDNGVIVGAGSLSGSRHGYMLLPLAAGDANADGAVDFLDLATLAQNYNSAAGGMTWEQGDFNGDGNVDFLDLALMAQSYNTVQFTLPPSQAAASLTTAVPEPGMAMSFALVAMGMACRRSKRSRLR